MLEFNLRSRSASAALLLLAMSLCLAVVAPQAPSEARQSGPRISWSFADADVSAGEKPVVRYSVRNVPPGAQVVVQRQAGSRKVWKTIAKVSRSTTSARIAGAAMGAYVYRMAILKDGKVLSASSRPLRSYGKVSLDRLLRANQGDAFDEGGTAEDRNGTPFTYDILAQIGGFGTNKYKTVLTLPRSSCSSLSLAALGRATYDSEDGSDLDLRASFDNADPRATSTPMGVTTTMSFAIPVGHAVSFAVQTPMIADVYMRGTGRCFTASGKRP